MVCKPDKNIEFAFSKLSLYKFVKPSQKVCFAMLFCMMLVLLLNQKCLSQNLNNKTAFEVNKSMGRGINIPSIQNMNAEHYKIIKKAGFNNVRIPIHPFNQTSVDQNFTLKPAFLEMVDSAVNRSLVAGLIPIIDFHEHNAMQKDPLGTKPMFLAIWRQLATHYKDFPAQVLFEIANEPNMKPEIWNQI